MTTRRTTAAAQRRGVRRSHIDTPISMAHEGAPVVVTCSCSRWQGPRTPMVYEWTTADGLVFETIDIPQDARIA